MWAGRQILWFLKEYSKILNKKKVPLVLTLHEAYPQIVKEGDLQSFTDAYKYANHIVVLTSDASRDLKKEGITIPISIIPHGNYHAMNKNLVSTEKAREIVGDCLSIPLKGMHTVLFIGYIRDYKGLIYLIRAAPYVLKKIPNTLFIAAGSLELAEKPLQYEQEIKRLGLEDKFIIYAKFIEDYLLFESFYKCADVVVYPYVGVSQSGTMLTAVGMKRPVIFSRLGSFIKKLEEQGVIMTFKPRDPKSLAEKIEYLLTHEEERKRMAENAYHVLERDYSWKRIASNYMEVFKRTS
jgi:glycosyltransferase involved in cell wall biosynthesis